MSEFGTHLRFLYYGLKRNLTFFKDLYQHTSEDQSGEALDGVGGDIYKGGAEAVQEAFESVISQNHNDFCKEADDDARGQISDFVVQ